MSDMAEIVCVGITVEDTFCGPMRALPPEGSLLAVDAMPVKVGGCAPNVAIDLAKQGLSVNVIGCLGRDAAAKSLAAALERENVGCDHLVYTDRFPTSKTVVLLVEGQDRRFIHMFGANQALAVSQIEPAWLDGAKVFYLGGLFAMPGIEDSRAARIAEILPVEGHRDGRGCGGSAPMGRIAGDELNVLLLPEIDYFTPNDDEAQQLTGLSDPLEQLRFFHKRGAHTVIITQGNAGAIAARGGSYWRSGIFPSQVVDPSGSGDAFTAGVVTAIHRGFDLPRMLAYASALGSSATRAVGTTDGVFTAAEAEAFLAAHSLTTV